MNDQTIRRLTVGGVLAAATFLLTYLIQIPMPGGLGYINLGDVGVLVSGALLGGGWGALCAAIATALADVSLGWAVYAPATALIKGATALAAGLAFAKVRGRAKYAFLYSAAVIVPLGYFLYESLLYGAQAALVNVPLNALQGLIGGIAAHALLLALGKTRLLTVGRTSLPASIVREPKGGAEVVLAIDRANVALIEQAADYLSVRGVTARLVALDDASAFLRLTKAEKRAFLPDGVPYLIVTDKEQTPQAIAAEVWEKKQHAHL